MYALSTFIVIWLFQSCQPEKKIFLHKDTPCVGKIFIPGKETILLQKQTPLALSIYDLEVYEKYIKEEEIHWKLANNHITVYRKEIKIYPKESSFEILGFYTQTFESFENSSALSYYLIRSLDDNKTIWLYASDFNSTKCNIELSSSFSSYSYNSDQTKDLQDNYKSTLIENGNFTSDSYSHFGDMLSISRKRTLER